MLKEIKNYIKERKSVPLTDIAIHFKMDESAIEGALQLLCQKQLIRQEVISCECSSGCGCESNCNKTKNSITQVHWNHHAYS